MEDNIEVSSDGSHSTLRRELGQKTLLNMQAVLQEQPLNHSSPDSVQLNLRDIISLQNSLLLTEVK